MSVNVWRVGQRVRLSWLPDEVCVILSIEGRCAQVRTLRQDGRSDIECGVHLQDLISIREGNDE